jgi:hypothetical protein
MIRNVLIASMLVLGTVGCAESQNYGGPRMVGGGDNTQVVYDAPSRNVVGGGSATITGGGDDMRIAYGSGVTVQERSGLVAELVGGGDNEQLVYHPVNPNGSMLAGHTGR